MFRMRFRSIRWRLVSSYVFLTLLVVSVVGALTLSLIKRYVERRNQEFLTSNAEAVARQAWPLMWPTVSQPELQELARTASFLGNTRVRILDGNYQVLADAWPSIEGDEFVWILPPLEWRVQVMGDSASPFIVAMPLGVQPGEGTLADGSFTMFEQLPPDTAFTRVRRWDHMWGSRFVFYVVPEAAVSAVEHLDDDASPRSDQKAVATIGDGRKPQGYVEISNGPDLGMEALRTIRQAFLLAAGGTTLIALMVGLLVSRGLSAPLQELATVAAEMSGGNLSVRAPRRGEDEIGRLAGQFNHMAERLEASFAELSAERDALRHFIADASHELRTPITALKNFSELLQGPAADDAATRTEFLAESHVQIERLEWVTRNLLDLSRLDAGLVVLDMADHDVGTVIRDVVAPFRPLAKAKGLECVVRMPDTPLTVQCDRERIILALSNLLDNAVKFTPPDGQIGIGAVQDGETIRLWVRDTGPGIAPADLPHIFDRFYRGGGQRDDHATGKAGLGQGTPGGLGLGLAIVQSIVQAHGGHVSAESTVGAGSRFTIELPQLEE